MSARRLMLLGASVAIMAGSWVDRPVLAQAGDQPVASAGGGLEEIVVTARRREEKLQTVPIGITVLNASAIAEKGIQSYSDLQHFVPSLEVRQQSRDEQNFFMRGQGINGTAGAWPGVVSYFAEVPWIETGAGNYVDLESVQALRGPQGTLFGRNTTGGAVLFEPKKPTNDYEGYAQLTLGNYNDEGFEGAVNIPIVQDKLLVRVAGSYEVRDGFTKDVSTGQELDNRDYWSGRVYVTFRPTDDFENDVIYSGLYSHTNGSSIILSGFNPNNVPGQPKGTFVSLFGLATAQSLLAQQQALGPRATATGITDPLDKTYHWGIIDKAIFDINDNLTVKNIASIQEMRNLDRYDQTGQPRTLLTIVSPYGWETSWEQYSDELQLQGKAFDNNLTWTTGGYVEFLHPAGQSVGEIFATPSTLVVSGALANNADGPANQTARSQALYAQGTYDLSQWVDGLKFTAGYRYTWDYRGLTAAAYTTSFGPKICTQVGATLANNCALSVGAPFHDPSWNLTLDYQLTPDTLVYVTGSHGYKSGGFNNNAPSVALLKYGSEQITNAELGVKSDWQLFGAQVRTNADLFHDDIANAQRSTGQVVTLPTGTMTTQTLVSNANVTIEGFELEGEVIPFKGFEVSGTYSYDFAKYDGPVLLPTTFGILTLPKIPYPAVPKNQISATARYHLPVDDAYGDPSFAAIVSYRSHDEFSTDGEPDGIRPGYALLDLRADWNNVMGYPADIEFFVNNATNKLYTLGVYDLYNTTGTVADVYGEPRMFGVKLKYRFGEPSQAAPAPTAYVPPPAMAPAAAAPSSYLVFFDFNKSDLTPQAVTIVDQAAKNAGAAKVTQLTVTGHTDTVGSDAYNMRLSRRRAESVAAKLEMDGIAASEIEIVAKGKRDLLVPTGDGVKEPQNRRVQIVYGGGAAS